MTVLSRLARPTEDDLLSLQCDVCIPPVISSSTEAEMREQGWLLVADGNPFEVCPWCVLSVPARTRRRRADSEPVGPDPEHLPNLIVIGAAKAGTTSLHSYLGLHPDIAMSDDKEMRFFTDPDCRSWLGTYQASFTAGTRYRGESTPQYTRWPHLPGVADRMADLVPDARLIYLVRDPVQRLLAEYVEEVTWGVMSGAVEDYLHDADAPYNRLVAPSRYARQLREFRSRFDVDRIKVVDLDDLAERPGETLAGIFDFLELPPIELSEDDLRPRNVWGDKGTHPGWYRALRRPLLIRAVHRLPAGRLAALRAFVRRRISKPVERPTLSEETLAKLGDLLAPDVAELREMTGLEFARWSV